MKILLCGINFPHGKGEFCKKTIFDYYTVCCFCTAFVYEKNGKLLEGNAGDILIMEPGKVVFHGPSPEANEGFRNDWIYIYGDRFTDLLTTYPIPLNTAFGVGHTNALRYYITKIKKEVTLKPDGFQNKINCIVTEMIIDIYRMFKHIGTPKTSESRLFDARNIIMQNPEQEWTLESMATLCGYSQSRFSALYKNQFGNSPKNDILKARINLAKKMLMYSSMSITDISENCGFKTIFHFSKYFKSVVGCSPSEYTEKFSGNLKSF